MQKRMVVLLVCLVTSINTFQAFAWDNPGHIAVAALACKELSSAQKTKLAAILRQHPDLGPISRGFPDGTVSDEDLVIAIATWPDAIKLTNGVPPGEGYKNIGYEKDSPAVTKVKFERVMHKGYHFIDTPLWVGTGPKPNNLPDAPQVNAVGVVNVLVSQLHSNETDAEKAFDLGWLIHLVGDLHQPLHAVSGYSETMDKGDTGGNDVVVHGVKGERELHGVWDDILGPSAKGHRLDRDIATATDIVDSVSSVALGANADDLRPETWATESFKIASRDSYNLTQEPLLKEDKPPQMETTLNATYQKTAARDAKKRIRMAGHRLALLLKDILGS